MGCTASKDAPIQPPAKMISIPHETDVEEQRLRDEEQSTDEHKDCNHLEDERKSHKSQVVCAKCQCSSSMHKKEKKVKLLLLGTGESGKSTIFKQMRILYGAGPKTDDDLRMYGVIVRSNIVIAIRKLCLLTRQLGYEMKLDEESAAATAADLSDVSGMTPREAYDQIIAYLVDNTATDPLPEISREQAERDWVGRSTRAGLRANLDAQQFLQHVEAIRVLWQVRYVMFCYVIHLTQVFRCNLIHIC